MSVLPTEGLTQTIEHAPTALTSTPHRRCTPKISRRISTIPAGNIGGRLVHVSAVDTGPRRSESAGFLVAQPGASVTGPPPARCLRGVRRSWFDAGSAPSRPESARVGLLHEGRDLLTKGCAYCTKAPPTPSTPNPPPVAPHPRAVHPDDADRHHSDQGTPPTTEAAALPSGRPTPPMP